jgi:hypothetical protein
VTLENKETAVTAPVHVTNKVERKYGGMPEYALARWYWSDIDGQRFLTRFILFRTPLVSVDVTRIHRADDQRPYPHDHSRSFASLKFGSYEEDVFYDAGDLTSRRHRRHRRFSVHLLRYTQAHSITRVSPHLVTVLFLGPKRQPSNYWTPDGKQTIGMAVDQPGKK